MTSKLKKKTKEFNRTFNSIHQKTFLLSLHCYFLSLLYPAYLVQQWYKNLELRSSDKRPLPQEFSIPNDEKNVIR
jgi:hypothetical protein